MKPCRKYRKQIAWLAAAALEGGEARAVRAHLETCAGCRGYLAEISSVTGSLAAADTDAEVEASERFHQRLAGRLRAARPDSVGEILSAYVRGAGLNWRMAAPVLVVLVVAGVTIANWRQPPKIASLAQTGVQAASVADADEDLAPTVANYQMVANQSLDKLDDLLTRQGLRNLPPAPALSASALFSANLGE